MKIQVLSDETINQIAAGEVIERPLSVVKELMENAIDAGSTAVSVEIRDGGISMIRVTDNGAGIAREDVRNAFLRHATSKIRDARDLESIQTLGFRGEALASIASVARVELITKTPGTLMAVHYQIEGGTEKDFSEIGAPDGTTFIVRDLFKNVPARRKFLKSPQAEAARIQDILEKEALAHPEVAFRYLQDGKQLLATLGNGSLLDVIYSIYGRDVTNQLITVNRAYQRSTLTGLPAVTIRGFIGKPVITRANRNYEVYFVNERYIRNPMIAKAIEDGYRAFLMQHKFPYAVLMIDVNPEIVDVNVHPQKLEVRFSDGMLIYNSVMDAVQHALHETELVVNTDLEPEKPEKSTPTADRTAAPADRDRGRSETPSFSAPGSSKAPAPRTLPHVEPFETKRMDAARDLYRETLRTVLPKEASPKSDIYVGRTSSDEELREAAPLFRTDAAAPADSETRPAAAVKPQAVAVNASTVAACPAEKETMKTPEALPEHTEKPQQPVQETLFSERFLSEEARLQHRIIGQVFETYWLVEYGDKLYIIDQHAAHEKVNFERMMKRLKEKEPVSQLLNPPILLTLSADEARLLEEHMEAFEKLGYQISGLGGRDYSISAVPTDLPSIGKKELLLEMLDDLSGETGMTTPESIYNKIASMSCKAAVKGNSRLSFREADALIGELLTLENPYACPHGRPTIISMSKTELEKKFKRIV